MRISSLQHAEQLLASIQDHVSRFTQSEDVLEPAKKDALADAISALENYLQHLTHGQTADVSRLQAALAEMARLDQAPEPVTIPPPEQAEVSALPVVAPVEPDYEPTLIISAEPPQISVPEESASVEIAQVEPPEVSTAIPSPSTEDQELLEIFLEEAQEVLGTMSRNLDTCQLHPDSHEPLVAIRRGFHTLKGSGRMVGLTELGEVAWCVERAMNKWLQDNKSATPGLLNFIRVAVRSFTGWVDMLSNQGEATIEADDLIAAAQQIENGLDSEILPAASPATELPDAGTGSAQDSDSATHTCTGAFGKSR